MIRVLQIISDTNIGGGGHSLLNYLRYRDRERVEVLVVMPRRSALKPAVEELGVEVAEIDAMADKSLDWKAIPLLRQLIHSWKPDLVHTHGSLSGRIAARLCGVRVLYTKHCAFPPSKLQTSPPGRLAGRILDWALSDGVVAVGPSAEENLTSTGIPKEKIHVLFNGVAPLKPAAPEERARLRERIRKTEKPLAEPKDRKPKKALKPSDLHLGDTVRVLSLNLEGTVSSLPDARGNLFVQMGILRSQVKLSDLELVEEAVITSKQFQKTSAGKIKMGKSASVSTEINLIGMTVDEALAHLDKYLDDAYLAHLPSVRIVHGKGTGALRKAVQGMLKRNKYVKSYRLGEFGEGDAGVTIASLKQD